MGLWGAKAGSSGLVEAYNAFVISQTAEAALAALSSMKGARLQLARSNAPELKTWIDDDRPPVLNDAELLVARFTTRRHKPIATLVNWANHPEAAGSKKHADLRRLPRRILPDAGRRWAPECRSS